MTTFVLVHGAWHGAWCWDQLVAELERRGHPTIAMDLPSEDADATFESYADAVCATLPEATDDAVLVGHSLAGHTVALVASRVRFRRLIYLCALVPQPGRSLLEQLRAGDGMLDPAYLAGLGPADERGRRAWVDEQMAHDVLYQDCSVEVAHAAFGRLRQQATGPYSVPCPLAELPDTPATYVLAAEDRLVGPQWSRRVAAEQLHADLVELPGGHSPFLARPGKLADVLEAAVGQ